MEVVGLTGNIGSGKSTVAKAFGALGIPVFNSDDEAKKAAKGDTVTDGYDAQGRSKYVSGKTQPRDAAGKFRKVLARLKQDLGVAGLQEALQQVEHAENLEFAGNYTAAAKASQDLLGTIDRLDTGALDATKIENVRATAGELGKVIANLPLPFTNQAQKVKFSDLPPALKQLMGDMIDRVEAKIGKKEAGAATAELQSYMSGADLYSQSEISSHMATLLRLLT
jgi:energy-coupling factor transporter ATP-binding protein EcfA2